MSTRMTALIATDSDTTPGNMVYGIETAIKQYLRDHARGTVTFEGKVTGVMMRKQGYQFPHTMIQGSPGSDGYALFTNFALVESGNVFNRTVQTSVGLPLTEHPRELNGLATNNSISLRIGDWGDAKDILMRIAEHISTDTYHIVDNEGNLESHYPQRLSADPMSAITPIPHETMSNKIYNISLPVSVLKDNADAASWAPWDPSTGNLSDCNQPIPSDHLINIWVIAPSIEAVDKLIERISLDVQQDLSGSMSRETDLPLSMSYKDGVDFTINNEGQCVDLDIISSLNKPTTKSIVSFAAASLGDRDPLAAESLHNGSEPTL